MRRNFNLVQLLTRCGLSVAALYVFSNLAFGAQSVKLQSPPSSVSHLPVISSCAIGGQNYKNFALARDRGVPLEHYLDRPFDQGPIPISGQKRMRALIREIYQHPGKSPNEVFRAYVAACERARTGTKTYDISTLGF
jgi:hypothetical protein